jgi:hypothetical protein
MTVDRRCEDDQGEARGDDDDCPLSLLHEAMVLQPSDHVPAGAPGSRDERAINVGEYGQLGVFMRRTEHLVGLDRKQPMTRRSAWSSRVVGTGVDPVTFRFQALR